MKRTQTDRQKMAAYCPLCESRFNPVEARTLRSQDDSQLIHVRCRRCANAMLVLLSGRNGDVSSVGLVTDLTFDDVSRFQTARVVTTDDVIEVHQSLGEAGFWAKLA